MLFTAGYSLARPTFSRCLLFEWAFFCACIHHLLKQCLWKEILSQQRIRHFKILQSRYFAYDVRIISSYSNNCCANSMVVLEVWLCHTVVRGSLFKLSLVQIYRTWLLFWQRFVCYSKSRQPAETYLRLGRLKFWTLHLNMACKCTSRLVLFKISEIMGEKKVIGNFHS